LYVGKTVSARAVRVDVLRALRLQRAASEESSVARKVYQRMQKSKSGPLTLAESAPRILELDLISACY
jgi:hypothetical protein